MKKFFVGLLLAAISTFVFGSAFAELAPVLISKQVGWRTWGPHGPTTTLADTIPLEGAAVDTSDAIWIGDMAYGSNGGPGTGSVMSVLKVTLVGQTGLFDNIDSLYFRVEGGPDGSHFGPAPIAANSLTKQLGVLAAYDYGTTLTPASGGSTINSVASFYVQMDGNQTDGQPEQTITSWALSPYIRIIIRGQSGDVMHGVRLFVSYVGYRSAS